MRWLHTEYILKGVYLGLVLFAALQAGAVARESWTALAWVNLLALAGLVLALGIAAVVKSRQGYRSRGRPVVYLFFLLLESPELVYAGILGGTLLGTFLSAEPAVTDLLLPTVGGGALAGVGFALLRQLHDRRARLGLILALAAGTVVGGLVWLGRIDGLGKSGPLLKEPIQFAIQLLLGCPFFYILTFAGRAEETEIEIGALCAMLGLGLSILMKETVQFNAVGFIVPLVLYFWYTTRLLTAVRVLKHVFRGLSYAKAGRPRGALQAFRRALELDPANAMARNGFWEVHRSLDVNQLAHDPETLALVDLHLCLERAGQLLAAKPSAQQLDEAERLLDLVLRLQPEMGPAVDYWRAVACTHARRLDDAAAGLGRLLDPHHYGSENPRRQAVLFQAWQLALTLHPELRRRVGEPQLRLPGRRMEAIAAVERHLATNAEDRDAWGMKRTLYHELTEEEFRHVIGGDGVVVQAFDFPYVEQLGLALINDNSKWQRGGEYLRMAAVGLLQARGPSLFVQIAQAHQRAGQEEEGQHAYELAKRAGRSVGPKNLPDPERQAYFAAVKYLAEAALARGDLDAAIENYHLYAESERSGLETLRTLAGLYEQKGDPLSALRVNDQALVYNAKDKDLLERKDRYYYSALPEQVKAAPEAVKAGLDLDYCLRRARAILDDRRYEGLEWLDVARHLIEVALAVRPDNLAAKVLLARTRLRYGERDEATAILEQAHSPKPERFASGEDEDAWFQTCQLLSDLYLEAGRADLAVPCLLDFRKSAKSGARTLLRLGQAYEALGDNGRAVRYYQQVTAYEGNPLTYEAHDALSRLGAR
jgi:tetratricopeptide (TPR) repeat protein